MGNLVRCTRFLGGEIEVPASSLVFRPSAYAIIVRDRRLLTIRDQHSGQLFLPGGGIDLGERAEPAARREVREETGLVVSRLTFWRFYETFFYHDLIDAAWHCHLFIYVAETEGDGRVLSDGDPTEGRPEWSSLDTSPPLELGNDHNIILQDYLRQL